MKRPNEKKPGFANDYFLTKERDPDSSDEIIIDQEKKKLLVRVDEAHETNPPDAIDNLQPGQSLLIYDIPLGKPIIILEVSDPKKGIKTSLVLSPETWKELCASIRQKLADFEA